IRLLVHRTPGGETTLLQRVYLSHAGTTALAGVSEDGVRTAATGELSRLSSASFPLSLRQAGTGTLGLSGDVAFAVDLGYNETTNPFLHTYHPDHDNLDARFESVLPEGEESYTIRRAIRLEFQSDIPGLQEPG